MSEVSPPLIIGHATHTGRVREINEDSYLILAPPHVHVPVDAFLMIADGVGGENAGEVASGLLAEMFWRWFANNDYAALVHYNRTHPDYFIVVLKDLLEHANEHLYHLANTNSHFTNMGTTATVAVLSRGRLFLGHVGDTRAYLFRAGRLQQLTADHSWVADEVAAGRLSPSEARTHPKRNLVNRVLGASLLLRVDRDAHVIQPGDTLILTSDGLTGLVQDSEIQEALQLHSHPQSACDQLVSLANQRGGTDNITILITRVSATEEQNDLANGIAIGSVYLRQKLSVSDAEPGTKTPVFAPEDTRVAVRADVSPLSNFVPSLSKTRAAGHLILTILLCSLMGVLLPLLIDRNVAWPRIGGFQINNRDATVILTALFAFIGYCLGHILPIRYSLKRIQHEE